MPGITREMKPDVNNLIPGRLMTEFSSHSCTRIIERKNRKSVPYVYPLGLHVFMVQNSRLNY